MPANYLGCDVNALLAASACLQWCVSDEDRVALELYVRALELAVDGTDYTVPWVNGNGQTVPGSAHLLYDAKAWVGSQTLNATNRKAIALYIDVLNAVAEGATLNLTTPAFPQEAMQFRSLPMETKLNLLLFLKCNLNSADEP